MSARIIEFPGVGDSPGARPASFDEYLVGIGLSEKTVATYVNRVDIAARICADFDTDLMTADAFVLAQVAANVAFSHSMRGQLRCSLKHWYEWQDRMDAPLRAVRVPPQPAMVCRALEVDEAKALVAVARGWWPEGAAVLLGMYLALRRFEIAKAEWSRFDDAMEWYTVTGKFDKTATIPVHPVIAEEFGSHRGERFIFPGRKNVRESVTPATIWSWTKEVGREAGLPDVGVHQLRHTSLTTALDNTSNLRNVMEFARHSRPQTTASYTRTTKEQLRSVSDALDF